MTFRIGLLVALAVLVKRVSSHGQLVSPRSRNFVASQDGIDWGEQPGVPFKEYCPHCLNLNHGVCGVSPDYDYDLWMDSSGQKMPWKSDSVYSAGDTIIVKTHLSTHHNGHMEIKGCPKGATSTQECFDDPKNSLIFIKDLKFGMPADPSHPERGYYAGGQASGIADFEMEFQLPSDLVGEKVLLQWKYITANSCSPPGYKDYFDGSNSENQALPADYWNSVIPDCVLPFPNDGSRSAVHPEIFFNCAEVTITGSGSGPTPTTQSPTMSPTTKLRGSTPAPTPVPPPGTEPTTPGGGEGEGEGDGCCSQDFKTCITWCGETKESCAACSSPSVLYTWLSSGSIDDDCAARWGDCTIDSDKCCPGLTCVEQNEWYSQCTPAPVGGGNTGNGDASPAATSPPTDAPNDDDEAGEQPPPTPKPAPQPPTPPPPTSPPATGGGGTAAAEKVENVLESSQSKIDNELFLYETPQRQWKPSSVYRFDGFLEGLRVMYQDGVSNSFFYIGQGGDSSSGDGYVAGLVNIAAFLAQSMQETIRYDACDENSWDLVNGAYPLSNACGQLGQSYGDYHCSEAEKHMECPVDPNMKITATTNAKWWGAPGPLKCAPKSELPFTGKWDHSKECNKPWMDPPESCDDYEGQLAGGEVNDAPFANNAGRTDVEGCCWWGRGVIQSTGVCNYGRLNYFLGKRAADEGRPSRYPTIDFCATPDAICASTEYEELKWIAGMFYWVDSVQSYDVGGWNYMAELCKFVDGGLTDMSFIDSVSGIVNRGCHNPPCAAGAVHAGSERKQNFAKVLDVFGL